MTHLHLCLIQISGCSLLKIRCSTLQRFSVKLHAYCVLWFFFKLSWKYTETINVWIAVAILFQCLCLIKKNGQCKISFPYFNRSWSCCWNCHETLANNSTRYTVVYFLETSDRHIALILIKLKGHSGGRQCTAAVTYTKRGQAVRLEHTSQGVPYHSPIPHIISSKLCQSTIYHRSHLT